MSQVGILQSVQIGRPQRYGRADAVDVMGREWETSFFREPRKGPRWLYTTYLEGNEQADKKNHGKIDQAVLMYAASHYPAWREELGREDIGPGGFGENFTVTGLSEETVCIGDIHAIGETLIQTQGPRYPCWKIERRWGIKGLTALVEMTGWTGWYYSVLREGMVEPGMEIKLVERSYPQWTMALINDFAHFRNQDVEAARALASCPMLHEFWGELVVKRAMGKEW